MTRRSRALWIAADVVMVGIILALLAATLLPTYVGPDEKSPEMPTVRERLRR